MKPEFGKNVRKYFYNHDFEIGDEIVFTESVSVYVELENGDADFEYLDVGMRGTIESIKVDYVTAHILGVGFAEIYVSKFADERPVRLARRAKPAPPTNDPAMYDRPLFE